MKKLTFVFALLILAGSSAFAQITKDQTVAEWTRAKAYTKAYLDAMPADGFAFKATPEVRTFAQQFLHLADANYFFIVTASGKESPLGKGVSVEKTVAQTKEATTKAVMDSYDFAISTIQGMTDAQFQEEVAMGARKATRGLLLAKAFEHQTHHRGQTTIYLRLKGVTPPPEMLF
ncbi:damage-inducible protein DinB [Mucilaginibacter terrigena]|uniref:Damage-inducible protein DinB n=1 Tax=Mucilaginibacter terrigena TaxID=2492395 RepID=A0A4Q5LRR4_9SPHI|nr:DinB family protein [Mucilaginibacter terrigena]RYU92211.1 damage-inducible protein DinB [Mucilaginibacter terrigena]